MDCISVGASNLESLRREYARLTRDLAAVENKLDVVQDPVEEARLQDRKREILSNSIQIEQQLKNCEAGSKNSQLRQVTTHWDEHLHKIDHTRSKNTTATILKRIEKSPSRSSLFLFQRYEKFLGKRYVEHLKKAIDSSDMGHFSQPYRVGLLDKQPTAMEFLRNLGEQLRIELPPSKEISVDLILTIRVLCSEIHMTLKPSKLLDRNRFRLYSSNDLSIILLKKNVNQGISPSMNLCNAFLQDTA
jgi:hypothetical protein